MPRIYLSNRALVPQKDLSEDYFGGNNDSDLVKLKLKKLKQVDRLGNGDFGLWDLGLGELMQMLMCPVVIPLPIHFLRIGFAVLNPS